MHLPTELRQTPPPEFGRTPTYDLFLSYRTKRAAEVARLVAALTARGLRVWQDVRRIDEGDDISEAVREGLLRSRALVAFWSEDYGQSRICLRELTLAWTLAERAGSPTARVGMLLPDGVAFSQVQGPITAGKAFGTEGGWDAAAERIGGWLGKVGPAGLGAVEGGALPTWAPGRRGGSRRFVGRDGELWKLHEHLRGGRATFLTSAPAGVGQLRGMAGVGKSLTAYEYALRFEAAYPGGVFLLNATASPDQHLEVFAPLLDPAGPVHPATVLQFRPTGDGLRPRWRAVPLADSPVGHATIQIVGLDDGRDLRDDHLNGTVHAEARRLRAAVPPNDRDWARVRELLRRDQPWVLATYDALEYYLGELRHGLPGGWPARTELPL